MVNASLTLHPDVADIGHIYSECEAVPVLQNNEYSLLHEVKPNKPRPYEVPVALAKNEKEEWLWVAAFKEYILARCVSHLITVWIIHLSTNTSHALMNILIV